MSAFLYQPNKILLSLLLPMFGQGMAAAAAAEAKPEPDSAQLETVVVVGKKITAADKPFKTIGGVSHRGEDTLGEGATSILRAIPGTFTQHDVGQPGVQVNVRGMEGFGRVNSMIDGVQQSGFQSNPAHGSAGNTTYVDENLLVGVDVQRGSARGADGAGSLGGAVNFRTIGVDDLVKDGKRFGAKAVYRFGNNGYGYNSMLSAAFKESAFGGNGSIGAIFAGTQRKTDQYENAAGEENIYQSNRRKGHSELFKIQIRPDEEQNIELSHVVNRNEFENNLTPLKVVNRTNYLKYQFNPMSDWINVDLNLNYNKMQQFYTSNDEYDAYRGKHTVNPAFGVTLQNTSEWQSGDVDWTWLVGGKLHRTSYEANFAPDEGLELPRGKSQAKSLFTNLDWAAGAWSGGFGLTYNRYQLEGYMPPCGEYALLCAQLTGELGGIGVSRKQHDLNPSVSLAHQTTDWLQVYAKWSKSGRGPSVQEMFYPDPRSRPLGINTNLSKERAENREIGFNIIKDGLWQEDDRFRMKVNYFNSKIDNYIINTQFYLCDTPLGPIACNLEDDSNDSFGVYINEPGTSKIHGFEVEGSYDVGRYYSRFSWTRTKTDLSQQRMAEFGIGTIGNLPESYWQIDVGSRWMDEKLTLGAKVSQTGKSLVPGGIDSETDTVISRTLTKSPKLFDLYGTYEIKKGAVLSVMVTNITNKEHTYALSRSSLASPMDRGTGSGRTYSLGLSMKF